MAAPSLSPIHRQSPAHLSKAMGIGGETSLPSSHIMELVPPGLSPSFHFGWVLSPQWQFYFLLQTNGAQPDSQRHLSPGLQNLLIKHRGPGLGVGCWVQTLEATPAV